MTEKKNINLQLFKIFVLITNDRGINKKNKNNKKEG